MEKRIRFAWTCCLVGGVLWVLTLALMTAFADGSVGFMVSEVVLVVVQVMLLIGVLGLLWSGAAGPGWFARGALAVALVGRILFVLAELHAIVLGSDDTPLLPLSAFLTAVGMLLVGAAVLRAGRWNGWARVMPLLCGLYPFVAMFPLIAITSAPNVWTIAAWGVCWALLGLALRASRTAAEPLRPATVR